MPLIQSAKLNSIMRENEKIHLSKEELDSIQAMRSLRRAISVAVAMLVMFGAIYLAMRSQPRLPISHTTRGSHKITTTHSSRGRASADPVVSIPSIARL